MTDTTAWIGPTNPFGLTASEGSYFLDLTNYQPGAPFAGVQQTIGLDNAKVELQSLPVPEPQAWMLMSAGALVAGTAARRRRLGARSRR